MRPRAAAALVFFCCAAFARAESKRVVIIKVDGLPGDLIDSQIDRIDPATHRYILPWMRQIFVERGAWMHNFYVRGISLSAPSWSLLDTGRHQIIRGNAEFNRYYPRVYDYLNFFPFYVGFARSKRADMPGVEVLDASGVPLFMDQFPPERRYSSAQLFQRGVHWETLGRSLSSRIARPVRKLIDEWQTGVDLGASIYQQEENDVIAALRNPEIRYIDFYSGDFDHVAHLTNDLAIQLKTLQSLDALLGRLWTAIQASPSAGGTVLALVSDHGMNSDPAVYSQGYNLVRFLNSTEGGSHNVITVRHPLTEYKLRGLDPFVSSVLNPASDGFFGGDYPTAELDPDGNERAALSLRNSDLNAIQILQLQMERKDFDQPHRNAIRRAIRDIADRNRDCWLKPLPKEARRDAPADTVRERVLLESAERDERGYSDYGSAMSKLLASPDSAPLPKGVLGEANTVEQLRHYIAGLSPQGLVFTGNNSLDLEKTFRHVDYLQALTAIRVRNNVQKGVGAAPIDFVAALRGDGSVLLYGDEQHQAILEMREDNGVSLLRYSPLSGAPGPGFPLHLYEESAWLAGWHSEREWFAAIHRTRYSNGLIGLAEYFRPGQTRRFVDADLLIFAADHWNFNVRGFNPGGNHGSLLRISTHSVLMFAGAGVRPGLRVEEPYDTLSFVPTLLRLAGLPADGYPGPFIEELFH